MVKYDILIQSAATWSHYLSPNSC